MAKAKTQAWDDFFDDLETGDVILMQGLFESSIFIERFTECHWSHAAIAVRSDDVGIETVPPGTVLLWESNIMHGPKDNPKHLEVTDVVLDKPKNGPILDRLAERISVNYALRSDGDVAKRKLDFKRNKKALKALKSVIEAIHHDDFPSIPWGEMGHFMEARLLNAPVTDDTYFCSQLVAHTFKAWGLLGNKRVDNWYAPANFAQGSWDTKLRKGAKLGKEIRLDTATIPAPAG